METFEKGTEMTDALEKCYRNTDKEIWREREGDYYADSIHVTEGGGIGINCKGHVIVAPVEQWHKAGKLVFCVNDNLLFFS